MKTKFETIDRSKRTKFSFGKQGESIVVDHLEKSGWKIVERNWRNGSRGELDIIAFDSDSTLVFIEVKTRRLRDQQNGTSHIGFDSIHGLKRHRILQLALHFLGDRCLTPDQLRCRFDVFVVTYRSPPGSDASSDQPEITHVRNAFHELGWN